MIHDFPILGFIFLCTLSFLLVVVSVLLVIGTISNYRLGIKYSPWFVKLEKFLEYFLILDLLVLINTGVIMLIHIIWRFN